MINLSTGDKIDLIIYNFSVGLASHHILQFSYISSVLSSYNASGYNKNSMAYACHDEDIW